MQYKQYEEYMASLLDELGIEYEREKTFKKLGALRFDFWLPQYRCCIEIDESHHFGDSDENVYNKFKDNVKNSFCLENGFLILRFKWTGLEYVDSETLLHHLKSDKRYKVNVINPVGRWK